MDEMQQWAMAPYRELMADFFSYLIMVVGASKVCDLIIRVVTK